METSKFAFKFFLEPSSSFRLEEVVPVFHSLIQRRALPGHLMVDVARYEHVPAGPGVVLVAQEANLSVEFGPEERLGVLYVRKLPLQGDLADRISHVLESALGGARAIVQALDGLLRLRADDPLFRVYDRLHAPNTPWTFAQLGPALQTALTLAYGQPVSLAHCPEAHRLLEVSIEASASAADHLLKREQNPFPVA